MFFNEWLDILLFRKKPVDIAGTSIGEGLKNLVIAGAIVGFLSGVLQYLATPQIIAAMGQMGTLLGALAPEPTLLDIVTSTIGTPIGAVIGMVIAGAILHIFCLIVGGKGSIGNYIGTLALIYAATTGTAVAALTVVAIIAALAGAYTGAMSILGILGLLVWLWQLVLVVLATQAVQQLSLGRAVVAVIVIPILVVIVLVAVLAAIILSLIASLLGGMTGALSPGTGGFTLPV